jgi:hypothetical protein
MTSWCARSGTPRRDRAHVCGHGRSEARERHAAVQRLLRPPRPPLADRGLARDPGRPVRTRAGWPPDARLLVEKAATAHGGFNRWRSVRSIRLPFAAASGMLLALKGYGRTFSAPREYEVRPHERTTIFHGYPDEEHQGRFVDGAVSIESLRDSGRIESLHHRDSFRGCSRNRRWTHLDALYFFGYALWHYHVVPFTLGDARFVRRLGRSPVPMGIEVEFAAEVHTHCRRQRFFFGRDGRIVRHDYVAEVIGRWARGCHFWEAYESVGGLQIARRRRVVARVLGRPTPLIVLRVDFGEPSVEP